MAKEYEIRSEVERTCPGLDVHMDSTGKYVWIADEQCSWWQPTEPLLAVLRTLPDHEPAETEEDEMMAYAKWCKATGSSGYFGHNQGGDTMPTPDDFWEVD
jgi:hypothetical protein